MDMQAFRLESERCQGKRELAQQLLPPLIPVLLDVMESIYGKDCDRERLHLFAVELQDRLTKERLRRLGAIK